MPGRGWNQFAAESPAEMAFADRPVRPLGPAFYNSQVVLRGNCLWNIVSGRCGPWRRGGVGSGRGPGRGPGTGNSSEREAWPGAAAPAAPAGWTSPRPQPSLVQSAFSTSVPTSPECNIVFSQTSARPPARRTVPSRARERARR